MRLGAFLLMSCRRGPSPSRGHGELSSRSPSWRGGKVPRFGYVPSSAVVCRLVRHLVASPVRTCDLSTSDSHRRSCALYEEVSAVRTSPGAMK